MVMQSSAVKLPRTIYLASASPRRRELLSGYPFELIVTPGDTDETVPPDWQPSKVVESLAHRKAVAVRDRLAAEGTLFSEGTFIVGADTVVAVDQLILGKPSDTEDAVRMLGLLQGRPHRVYTGIAIVHGPDGTIVCGSRSTEVHMNPMSNDVIRRYADTGEPLDKAGAYAIQGILSTHISRIDGCYFNVVGFSPSLFAELLASFGMEAW